MSIKTYTYRIETNKVTLVKLQWVINRALELYNAVLTERKEAWRMTGKSIGYYEQKRDLVPIKELRPEYQGNASHVLPDVIVRVKHGEKPGHPRFKGRHKYHSFTYPDHTGWKLIISVRVGKKRQ